MKLIKIKRGRFSEIEHLNTNFKHDSLQICATVETTNSPETYLARFPDLLFSVLKTLPNLKHHHCHTDMTPYMQRSGQIYQFNSPLKLVGDVIDTVHLLEHVALEIQCQLDNLEACSGLTCNYWEPENRFDIFIECKNPRIAIFSFRLALRLCNAILNHEKKNMDIGEMILLAQTINKTQIITPEVLARKMEWPLVKVYRCMKSLEGLNFPAPWWLMAA